MPFTSEAEPSPINTNVRLLPDSENRRMMALYRIVRKLSPCSAEYLEAFDSELGDPLPSPSPHRLSPAPRLRLVE